MVDDLRRALWDMWGRQRDSGVEILGFDKTL